MLDEDYTATSPSPEEIKRARRAAGLNTRDAAELVYISGRTWEDYEQGRYRMPPDRWEVAQHKLDLEISEAGLRDYQEIWKQLRIKARVLTPRQQRFVEEYARIQDSRVAYRRAGYTSKNPATQAARLKAKPHIRAAIAERERVLCS